MVGPREPERLGTALRRLAADLVEERTRVKRLRRENRELRAQLEALRSGRQPAIGSGTKPGRSDQERRSA